MKNEKKIFIGINVLALSFILIYFISVSTSKKEKSVEQVTESIIQPTSLPDSTTARLNEESLILKQKVLLEEDIDYLKDFYFMSDDFTNSGNFINAANIFTNAANHAEETDRKYSSNKELKSLADQLLKKLPPAQKKYFPKLRKSYAVFMRKKLWENDVDVVYSGTTITFIGAFFAANANIKSTQETVSDMLILLRFKQVNYKWMKYADEFIYYKLDSHNDTDIVTE